MILSHEGLRMLIYVSGFSFLDTISVNSFRILLDIDDIIVDVLAVPMSCARGSLPLLAT